MCEQGQSTRRGYCISFAAAEPEFDSYGLVVMHERVSG
jgi:hypothetical protein